MTNLQMKYFIKVYELASITAAAEELYVSRPVISRVINELEAEFEAVLFERLPRGVKPTEAGDAVYKLFTSTLKYYESTVERLKCLDEVKKNPLIRVGVLTTNVNCVYDKVIKGYMKLHPEIRFVIIERSIPDNVDALYHGEADILFLPQGSTEYEDMSFGTFPMFINDMALGVSRNSELADKKIITLEDLLDMPLGIRDTPLPNRDALDTAFKLFDRRPNIIVTTSSSDVLKDMTESGKCCALLTESMMSEWSGAVTIPVDVFRHLHNYMVWNQSIPLSEAVHSFIGYAKQMSETANGTDK